MENQKDKINQYEARINWLRNSFNKSIKRWKYTLKLWDYHIKIDIVLMALCFISGFLLGVSLWS